MWADPNLNEFYDRAKRVEKLHSKGYGFEAPGTMSRSRTNRRSFSIVRTLRSIAVIAFMGLMLKGAILFYVGEEVYERRVGELATGTGIDPFAATLMSADPATKVVAAFLAEVFPS